MRAVVYKYTDTIHIKHSPHTHTHARTAQSKLSNRNKRFTVGYSLKVIMEDTLETKETSILIHHKSFTMLFSLPTEIKRMHQNIGSVGREKGKEKTQS